MSEYWGVPLLPFFSCAPTEKVPRLVFDLLSPQVKHVNGVAVQAPYGVRKLEASLLRAYGPNEVVVAHPDHVAKFIDEKTSVIGISEMDPLGLGPVSMMFTNGGKLTAYTKQKFLELVNRINTARKNFPNAKLVIGGSGAWQMEVREDASKRLGVNHIVMGECDHVIGEIYKNIESNASPEIIRVPRGPKLEDIPDIVGPSELGPTGHSDYLRARVGFYVLVNLANNVIALAHDNMIDAEAFARVLPDLHLPCARPSDHQFRIREILPCRVYAVDKFQEFLFRVSGQFSPVRKHHTDRA